MKARARVHTLTINDKVVFNCDIGIPVGADGKVLGLKVISPTELFLEQEAELKKLDQTGELSPRLQELLHWHFQMEQDALDEYLEAGGKLPDLSEFISVEDRSSCLQHQAFYGKKGGAA